MKSTGNPFERLQELPAEMFEQGGKLGLSEHAPVITVIPDKLPEPKPPTGTIAGPNRSSYSIRHYYVQVIYPKLICYPQPEPEFSSAMRLQQNGDGIREGKRDLLAVSRTRLYYKLSRFDDRPLSPFWLCMVQYGPWLAVVEERESCTPGESSRWLLSALSGEIELVWYGQWEDIPSYPNLQVIMNDLHLFDVQTLCCAGYHYCATTMGCIPTQVTCQPPQF